MTSSDSRCYASFVPHVLRLGQLISLGVDSDGGLPTAFRIFRAGVNETSQGPIVFDDAAAESIMSAFKRQGVDLMIDLAHDSVSEEARANRTDADDARGWCHLEVREGPELWAVGVSWTPDGARRLEEKTQRYISPVVFVEEETGLALEIFNLALCSMPATYNAAPLVAARRRLARDRRQLETELSVNTLLDLVSYALRQRFPKTDDGPWVYAEDVYDTWLVYDLGGEFWRVSYSVVNGQVALGVDDVRVQRTYEPIAAVAAQPQVRSMTRIKMLARAVVALARTGDEAALVALEMTPDQAKKAIAAVKAQDGEAALAFVESMLASALGAEAGAAEDEAPAEPLADAPEETPPEGEDATALCGPRRKRQTEEALRRFALAAGLDVGTSSTDVEAEIRRLRSEMDGVIADRAVVEADERRRLVGDLVRLEREIPATAWENAEQGLPVKRLRDEPIADLRKRVAVLRKARPERAEAKPPDAATAELTEDQRKIAEQMTPAQRERFVTMLSNRGKRP